LEIRDPRLQTLLEKRNSQQTNDKAGSGAAHREARPGNLLCPGDLSYRSKDHQHHAPTVFLASICSRKAPNFESARIDGGPHERHLAKILPSFHGQQPPAPEIILQGAPDPVAVGPLLEGEALRYTVDGTERAQKRLFLKGNIENAQQNWMQNTSILILSLKPCITGQHRSI